jgi:hypothetical protein
VAHPTLRLLELGRSADGQLLPPSEAEMRLWMAPVSESRLFSWVAGLECSTSSAGTSLQEPSDSQPRRDGNGITSGIHCLSHGSAGEAMTRFPVALCLGLTGPLLSVLAVSSTSTTAQIRPVCSIAFFIPLRLPLLCRGNPQEQRPARANDSRCSELLAARSDIHERHSRGSAIPRAHFSTKISPAPFLSRLLSHFCR